MLRNNVRYSIVGLALLLNMVSYADRVCISVAAPAIRQEFQLDAAQLGLVFSIFSLAYALGQTPWGVIAERFGARMVITFAVLAWSVFTAATGFAQGYLSLLMIRFTFGSLEAAFSPAVATAFRHWIPPQERSAAFGFFIGGGRLGGAISPTIAAASFAAFGWRPMFWIFGSIGAIGAIAWYAWYRNTPREHSAITESELNRIESASSQASSTTTKSWNSVLTDSRFWSLLGVVFGATFLWQFYITWFPTYLMEQRKMSLTEASVFTGLPFLLGLFSTWLGGLLTDIGSRKLGVETARRYVGLTSLSLAALFMSAGLWCEPARPAALLMALAAGAVDLYLGAAWAIAVEIGGRLGGAVAGLMNAASNGAGFLSPLLMGWVLKVYGSWDTALIIGVSTTVLAALLWTNASKSNASV